MLDRIIGVSEASEMTGYSPGYIKNLCAENKLPAKKIGNNWVIDSFSEEFLFFMENRAIQEVK